VTIDRVHRLADFLFTEVGLSSGAVYGYFDSKEDAILAIAEEGLSEVISIIHPFAAAPRGEGLGNALGDVLAIIERKHGKDRTGAIAVLGWAEARRNHELARRAAALLAPLRADLAQLVREHQAQWRPATAAAARGARRRADVNSVWAHSAAGSFRPSR
jgi:AcrR family transcriptional regulator